VQQSKQPTAGHWHVRSYRPGSLYSLHHIPADCKHGRLSCKRVQAAGMRPLAAQPVLLRVCCQRRAAYSYLMCMFRPSLLIIEALRLRAKELMPVHDSCCLSARQRLQYQENFHQRTSLRLLLADIQISCHTVTSMLRLNGHHQTVTRVKHMTLMSGCRRATPGTRARQGFSARNASSSLCTVTGICTCAQCPCGPPQGHARQYASRNTSHTLQYLTTRTKPDDQAGGRTAHPQPSQPQGHVDTGTQSRNLQFAKPCPHPLCMHMQPHIDSMLLHMTAPPHMSIA
jgi:hypothetical protein